ncbi:MAG: hypothetical protein JJT82_06475 [Legionellaceae bacterium]|nr:hypothetical protein [Legionellaceae bacterium]
MGAVQGEMELKQFFAFLWQKKWVFVAVVVFCAVIGVVKASWIQRHTVASVRLLPPTNRDISALNYQRNAGSKIKALTTGEVFSLYRDWVMMDLVRERFADARKKEGLNLNVTYGPGAVLNIVVSGPESESVRHALQAFLSASKAEVLDDINGHSNATAKTMRSMVKADILYYQRLAQQALAERPLAYHSDSPTQSDALPTRYETSFDRQWLAGQYQAIAKRYQLELAGMRTTVVTPEHVELYHLGGPVLVKEHSPWPARVKKLQAFLILGVILGIMLLLLLFLLQVRAEDKAGAP